MAQVREASRSEWPNPRQVRQNWDTSGVFQVASQGIAAKAAKECAYHLRHASEWVIRLGDGTAESRRRMQQGLDELWMYTGELFEVDDVEREAARAHAGPTQHTSSSHPSSHPSSSASAAHDCRRRSEKKSMCSSTKSTRTKR
jgi:hypothetical protein